MKMSQFWWLEPGLMCSVHNRQAWSVETQLQFREGSSFVGTKSVASLGDLDGRMHEERWGDSFEGGRHVSREKTKQEMDRLESLTHATSKPQPFFKEFWGRRGGGGHFVSFSLSRRKNGTFVLGTTLSSLQYCHRRRLFTWIIRHYSEKHGSNLR